MKIMRALSLVPLLLGGTASAGFIPELRSMKVNFEGDGNNYLFRYSSFCRMNAELFNFYYGKTDRITMPISSKESMMAGLQDQGNCMFPNGMQRVGSQGYRAFHKTFYCSALPGEMEHQERLHPGSYRHVSTAAFAGKLFTGACSYTPAVTFCRKTEAIKVSNASLGIDRCQVNADGGATVFLINLPSYTYTASEIQLIESRATTVADINDEIYVLETERAACDAMSNKFGCGAAYWLLKMPNPYARGAGLVGGVACFWATGACVRIYDVKLKDKEYEKMKLREEQEEREREAKAKGAVLNPSKTTSVSTGTSEGAPIMPGGVILPDQFPPTYSGEVIITEAPPGPMPGTGTGPGQGVVIK